MNHRTGLDRSQTLLFPETLEDYVTVENPVRFLDAFVSGLDLHALGFAKAIPEATGRPPYHPADLLKLYLYGRASEGAPGEDALKEATVRASLWDHQAVVWLHPLFVERAG